MAFSKNVAVLLCTLLRFSAVVSFFTPHLTSITKTFRPNSAFVPRTILFSDISESAETEESVELGDEPETEASVIEAEESEEKKRAIKRERHTLFVGNLPFETTDEELRDLFSQSGTVQLVSIPINKETGRKRGFAFVDMSSKEEVQAAIESVGGSDFGGRTLRVTESLPKDEARKQAKKTDEGTQKIYVGNMPFDATRADVEDLFSSYGEVRDVYLPLNQQTGAPRGFAFVTLPEENAEKAIEETNGLDFLGRPLVVSLPLPPGERGARRGREPRQKLYIGNLSFYTVPDTLRELFEEFGEVHDCYMPEDPESGGSRGFGFVTIDKTVAEEAIRATDGCELDGRIIRVNEAQPKGSFQPKTNGDDDGDWSDEGDGY